MNYPMLLDYGLVGDLHFSSGSGELDDLSDHMLQDIGYKRVGGHVIKDQGPLEEPVVQRSSWSWSLWGRNRVTPKVSHHSATLA
ncbi:MAG: hypothetical protein ABW043_18190 [Devosia sp.]|uniref:hypothetical protein n=1 Tax=Devosia sp. TaxID=1871048 RepID=UPI003397698C